METLKSFVIVLSAPVIIMTCFCMNVIPSKNLTRQPAIEKVKQYHFNKSLLAQITKR